MAGNVRALIVVVFVGAATSVSCRSVQSASSPPATTTSVQPGVELVRNGVLADYNATTVGKALEASFQNSKWKTFETPKGAKIVQFDATAKIGDLWKGGFIPSTPDDVKEKAEECRTPEMKEALRSLDVAGKTQEFLALRNAHDAKVNQCIAPFSIPIRLQFQVSADAQSFQLSYFQTSVFGRNQDEMLRYIYR